MSRIERIAKLIDISFKENAGFFYTAHARKRMVERHITVADVENAYFTGHIIKVELESDTEIKFVWKGQDRDGEWIRLVMVYLVPDKTIIITVMGD